jgi:signal transduction histidine kinase
MNPQSVELDGKVNILLVDDQPSKLLSYEAILSELGENLIKASSAREALEALLKTDVAVILVDVCMPEQDGFELVETIRTHHRFEQTAIIFVSAVQMDDLDRLKGYASGAVDYISVPIVPEILRAKVAVFVDLYRKTAQLAALNQELEQRVVDRTAELGRKEEALRDADRRKDEFLATLAHELRNPLAPMRTSLEILSHLDMDQPVVNRACDTMKRQLSQLTRLIDDLMDVSRITRNKLELRLSNVDLKEVIGNAIESSRPTIDAAKQKLEVSLPCEDVAFQADGVRLAQIVSNLLNNASKYTGSKGRIWLDVAIEKGDVLIRVRDNGIGLAQHDLKNVFEPFYQVSRSIERAQGGLGIGLTLVRTIVKMHGGSVGVRSEGYGKGSEFEVRIPLTTTMQEAANKPQAKDHTNGLKMKSHKVLVVDDNKDAAESLTMLLKFSGHEVAVAHDGTEAIEMARSFGPELVLMDIGMPGMNGYDAAKAIRSEPWGKGVVLVALTGWGQEEDRRKTAEAGFDRHLVKPVEFEQVNDLFSDLSKVRKPVAESPAPSIEA